MGKKYFFAVLYKIQLFYLKGIKKMMIKPIKVPPNFKGASIVFDDKGQQRHLSEIVELARAQGYNPAPEAILDTYEPPSKATRREIEDYRRIMDGLKEPERFDAEV